MKKIDRLRYIEKNFGLEFVLRYFLCKTWGEIEKAIHYFENKGLGWGMRTDTFSGNSQKFMCPFLFKGSIDDARKIWKENGRGLYYIVCENILEVLCHGVAELLDEEHIFIEFNDREPHIAQRHMYERPENLRHLAVGPNSFVFRNEVLVRSFHPEEVVVYSFDKIYYPMIANKIRETTFTVTPNGKVIVW